MDLKTFAYQPTLEALEYKKIQGTDYAIVHNSKLKPLYTAFLHSIKLPGYKMGTKFDKDPQAIEQNNYLTKIVNVYIVYDFAAWPEILHRNFTLKIVGLTIIVENSDKERYVYSGQEQHLMEKVSGILVMTMLEML